jgi:hypothetical protein
MIGGLVWLAQIEPARWIQPTYVGVCWGLIFVAGVAAGSIVQGKAIGAILASILVMMASSAVVNATDIQPWDHLLLTMLLLTAGWTISKFDFVAIPRYLSASQTNLAEAQRQWSIWDIGVATLLTAGFCQAWPRISSPPWLLLDVSSAVGAGALCSWFACRWVWYDEWRLRPLACQMLLVVVGISTVFLQTPRGATPSESLKWALAGPINVVAAQGLTVILLLAWIRYHHYDASRCYCATQTQRVTVGS